MPKKKVQVLFICTGNSARSQMSEALLRKEAGDIADVHSAGIKPAADVNPLAKRMILENGMDTSGHYTKGVDKFLDKKFDIIITTCDNAQKKCPVFPGDAIRYHWSLEDPSSVKGSEEERLSAFRETFSQISERVKELVKVIQRIYEDPNSKTHSDLEIPNL
jgi:arsenate reductase